MADTSHPRAPRKLTALTVGGVVPHHNLLPDPAVAQWSSNLKQLTAQWRATEDPLPRRRVTDLSGCLEKLAATLLQGNRVRQYHDSLVAEARGMLAGPGQASAYQGSDACADFEALLLQGRAALDRLTWFISDAYNNRCKSFRRIKNVLSNFARKDKAAEELLAIAASADEWFDGTFGKLESSQSLRDLVAHHHALVEGTRTCFGITRAAQDRAIVFDCEVQLPGLATSLPVFKTAHRSIQFLSFLILNSVSVFLGIPRLPLASYDSTWRILSVVFSEYAIPEPEGAPLGANWISAVRRMTPDGFEVATYNVDPSMLRHSIGR